MKRILGFLGVLVMMFGVSVSADAALVDMGDGTIYDTDTQLSWLKDANTAGGLNWAGANAWAASLNTGSGYAGLTGWRLPTTSQPDASCSNHYDPGGGFSIEGWGYYCANNEMSQLYYALGNTAGGPLTYTGLFTNLGNGYYWLGNEYAPSPDLVYLFFFHDGSQGVGAKYVYQFSWAVRPGARTLPTPVGYNPQWLIITLVSLIGAGGYMLRRRTARQ